MDFSFWWEAWSLNRGWFFFFLHANNLAYFVNHFVLLNIVHINEKNVQIAAENIEFKIWEFGLFMSTPLRISWSLFCRKFSIFNEAILNVTCILWKLSELQNLRVRQGEGCPNLECFLFFSPYETFIAGKHIRALLKSATKLGFFSSNQLWALVWWFHHSLNELQQFNVCDIDQTSTGALNICSVADHSLEKMSNSAFWVNFQAHITVWDRTGYKINNEGGLWLWNHVL